MAQERRVMVVGIMAVALIAALFLGIARLLGVPLGGIFIAVSIAGGLILLLRKSLLPKWPDGRRKLDL